MGLCPPVCPPMALSPVALTAAGGTAALGVFQQLGGAAGPGGVPLPVALLQPQPGRLVLGKGAQVLGVAPVHLGEKEGGVVTGGLAPQLSCSSGETESGEQQTRWYGLPALGRCQARGQAAMVLPGEGAAVLLGARWGVRRGGADEERGDRWRSLCPHALCRQLAPPVPVPGPTHVLQAPQPPG